MEFIKRKLNIVEYEEKISKLLVNKQCIIFLDTNVLIWLYRLSFSAREEFFSWVKKMIDDDRLFIPSWVLNEYNKHIIKNDQDVFFPFKKNCNATEKNLSAFENYSHLIVDDKFLIGSTFSTVTDYKQKISSSVEILKTANKLLKNGNGKIFDTIHEKISEIFESRIIKNNLTLNCVEAFKEYESRFSNEIPPGYKDDKKDTNAHGDLIVWKEILSYSKENQFKSVLLITNDSKNDWVYKPEFLENREGKIEKNYDYYLPVPQLIDEFKNSTDSYEFNIINIPKLISILFNLNNIDFQSLAIAIQLISILETPNEETNNAVNDGFLDARIDPPRVVPQIIPKKTWIGFRCIDETLCSYSESSIQDYNFDFNSDCPIIDIIRKLKSYNWQIQNPAIDRLNAVLYDYSSKIKEEDDYFEKIKDSIFVLGRNIYQAACGRCFNALRFLKNFEAELIGIDRRIVRVLMGGIIFENYFNSHGYLRAVPKSDVYLLLSQVCLNSDYNGILIFINDELEKQRAFLLYKLGQEEEDIIIEASVDKDLSKDGKALIIELKYKNSPISEILEPETDEHVGVVTKKPPLAYPFYLPETLDNDSVSIEEAQKRIADYLKIPNRVKIQIEDYERLMLNTKLALKDIKR